LKCLKYTPAELGKLIRQTRKKLGVTQKDLAMTSGTGRRCLRAGWTRRIKSWRRDRVAPQSAFYSDPSGETAEAAVPGILPSASATADGETSAIAIEVYFFEVVGPTDASIPLNASGIVLTSLNNPTGDPGTGMAYAYVEMNHQIQPIILASLYQFVCL